MEDVATQSAVAEDYSSPQFLLIPDTLLHVHQVEGLEPLVLRAVEATAATPDLQGTHVFNSMRWTLSEHKVVGGSNRVDSESLWFKTLILRLILDCSILANMKVVQTSHLIGGIKHLALCLPLTSGQVSSDNQTRRWFEQSMGRSYTINQNLVLILLLVSDITE